MEQGQALSSSSSCTAVGWLNASHVLLQPDETYRFVAACLRDTEDRSLLPLRDYYTMMITELHATPPTASEHGRVGVKRSCGCRAELFRRPTLAEEIAATNKDNGVETVSLRCDSEPAN